MSITIELEPGTEKWLNERAEREGREPAQFISTPLHHTKGAENAKQRNAPSEGDFAVLQTRTPEQIAEARERVLAHSRRAKPLPPGKTLEDMVFGKWPGEETDKEINTALEDLS